MEEFHDDLIAALAELRRIAKMQESINDNTLVMLANLAETKFLGQSLGPVVAPSMQVIFEAHSRAKQSLVNFTVLLERLAAPQAESDG